MASNLRWKVITILVVFVVFASVGVYPIVAAHYGVPVSVGNSLGEVSVHVAAALPEFTWIEYSFLGYERLLADPILPQDGYLVAGIAQFGGDGEVEARRPPADAQNSHPSPPNGRQAMAVPRSD